MGGESQEVWGGDEERREEVGQSVRKRTDVKNPEKMAAVITPPPSQVTLSVCVCVCEG